VIGIVISGRKVPIGTVGAIVAVLEAPMAPRWNARARAHGRRRVDRGVNVEVCEGPTLRRGKICRSPMRRTGQRSRSQRATPRDRSTNGVVVTCSVTRCWAPESSFDALSRARGARAPRQTFFFGAAHDAGSDLADHPSA